MKRLITRDKSFYRTLIALAIPVALQNLITFAVTLADNLMVGRLGNSAVSGVYMGGQIQTFLQMFSGGIEGAILILAAQYWGRKDTRSIKKIVAIGLMFALACGAALTCVCCILPRPIIGIFTHDADVIEQGTIYLRIVCFSYIFFCVTQALIAAMRSVEVARIGMMVSGISLCVNIVLNYVLIFGKLGFPAMGVAGAALATVISRMVETLVMVIYAARHDNKLRLRLKELRQIDPVLLRDFVKYGLPVVGGNVVWRG